MCLKISSFVRVQRITTFRVVVRPVLYQHRVLNILYTTDAAIALENGCQGSVDDLLPSAKSDTAFITAHSVLRSDAAAYRPKM